MNKDNNSVTITLPDDGMCALVKKADGRYEINTGRIEGKDVFLSPQPDPETGLVRCGCGGRAIRRSYDDDDNDPLYVVQCENCSMCTIVPSCTQKAADKTWNRARGWKGGAE